MLEACRRTTSLAPSNSLRAGRPAAKALASAALALALALGLALALALVLALSLPMPPPWPLLFLSPLTASLSIIQYGSRFRTDNMLPSRRKASTVRAKSWPRVHSTLRSRAPTTEAQPCCTPSHVARSTSAQRGVSLCLSNRLCASFGLSTSWAAK